MRPARQAVTLVTGASAGIGRELARLAARDSRSLILVARRRERLVALQEELAAAHPGLDVHPWACDLADARERRALVAGLAAKGLQVDHLINNAGAGDAGRFAEMDRARLQAQVELDVTAVHDLLLAFVPAMVERGYGRILNVSSTAAFQPLPWMATYAASKAFVLHLSEALSVELRGRGVTVTCLCPGRTKTEFFDAAAGHDKIFFSRMPTADAAEVARAGYEAMLAGRRLVVPTLRDRLSAWSARVSPRPMVLSIAERLFRPERA
ncbi:MAG TPA: SDR family oxidoreductase [Thermoanaerobaculia bacterium]|nr:SDR family oxidoreductase [Thermoanaerobaculia bacterium]